jgi:hypothetical protein
MWYPVMWKLILIMFAISLVVIAVLNLAVPGHRKWKDWADILLALCIIALIISVAVDVLYLPVNIILM